MLAVGNAAADRRDHHQTEAMNKAIILASLILTSLVSTPALAQQDRNLYFQSPDGSINIIVPGGPGYVITPFPNGSGGYNGYTVSPSYPATLLRAAAGLAIPKPALAELSIRIPARWPSRLCLRLHGRMIRPAQALRGLCPIWVIGEPQP
jgi:hypothetical protein